MTKEDKYKEALLEARAVLEPCLKYSNGKVREALDSIDKELKSFESEDERIRKLLIWQVHRNIEDETNDLAGSVYDGIKGHDPELEESIEDWKKCLAWLEKQKEQKPVEPSDDELQRHQDELYDFKVFAAKQAKEHHISFVHDFEWNNFCAELLSYFNEQKPAEPLGKLSREEYLYQLLIDQLITYSDYEYLTGKNPAWSVEDKAFLKVAIAICNKYSHKDTADWLKSLPERFNLQPKVEWSEEDIKKIRSEEYTKGFNDAAFGGKLKEWSKEDENMAYFVNQFLEYHENADPTAKSCKKWFNNRFKSLKPHWKPSEEQMKALQNAVALTACDKELARLYNQLKKL